MSADRTTRAIAERFWTKVDQRGEDECWEWTGARDQHGYGTFAIKRERLAPHKAHRIAYRLASGQDPGDLLVCHTCDNPPCCNPSHLFLGTNADNVRDASAKGRLAHGADHWMRRAPSENAWGGRREVFGAVRLADDDVRRIRADRARGDTYSVLALRYGVTKSTIGDILTGRTRRGVV